MGSTASRKTKEKTRNTISEIKRELVKSPDINFSLLEKISKEEFKKKELTYLSYQYVAVNNLKVSPINFGKLYVIDILSFEYFSDYTKYESGLSKKDTSFKDMEKRLKKLDAERLKK